MRRISRGGWITRLIWTEADMIIRWLTWPFRSIRMAFQLLYFGRSTMIKHIANLYRYGIHGSICLFEQAGGEGFFQIKKYEADARACGIDAVVPIVGFFDGKEDALLEFCATHGLEAKQVKTDGSWHFWYVDLGQDIDRIKMLVPLLLDVLGLPRKVKFRLGALSLHLREMYDEAARLEARKTGRFSI